MRKGSIQTAVAGAGGYAGLELARLLLLFRSQMFPGFHPIQHPLLLLRGETGEMLQSLPQLLLTLRRQTAECRIVAQGALLFSGRQILVPAQPVTSMSLPRVRRLRTILIRR